MKKLLNLILINFLSLFAFADIGKDPVEWGKFSKEELAMKTYGMDSSASAVILAKFGSVNFEVSGGELIAVYECLIRIKILDESGLNYGDVNIPYVFRKDIDRFYDLKAHTINSGDDGKTVETKVDKDLIIDENVNGLYHRKKFAFPNLHKGSIIEYYYKIKSDNLSFLKEWNFQEEIPIIICEYRTYVPEILKYSIMTNGVGGINKINRDKTFLSIGSLNSSSTHVGIGTTNNNSYQAKTTTYASSLDHIDVDITAYIMENVQAIREEHYSIFPVGYGSFNMQLYSVTIPGRPSSTFIKNWKEFSEYIDKADWFGDQVRSNSFAKDLAMQVSSGLKNENEIIASIYIYVKNNIVWNGDYDFFIDDLKTSFRNKSGNGTEVNSILLCMLRAMDIKADPVLLSTRDNGILQQDYTFLRQFNHLAVLVTSGNDKVVLDATDPFRPMSLQNQNLLGVPGLIPDKENPIWIEINSSQSSKEFYNYYLTLDKEGNLKGKVSYSCNNYSGLTNRKRIRKKGLEDSFSELINAKAINIKPDSITVQNLDSLNANLTIKSNITSSVSTGDKFIYLTPYLNSDLHVNPFKAELRQNPIEFYYPGSETSTMTVQLPDGYKIDEIPKSIKVTLPDSAASFTFISSNTNNQIQLKSILTINKVFYPVEEYKEVRDFFSNISAKYSEQIVISKE